MKTTPILGITAALLIAAYAYSQTTAQQAAPAPKAPRSSAETPPMQPLQEPTAAAVPVAPVAQPAAVTAAEPVQAMPVQAPPMEIVPAQAPVTQVAPVAAAPVQAQPIQAQPVQVVPVQAAPVAANPPQVIITPASPAQAGVNPAVPVAVPVAGQPAAQPMPPAGLPVQLGQPAPVEPTVDSGAAAPAAPGAVTAAPPVQVGGVTSQSVPMTNSSLTPKNEIRMNFQGAQLSDVLNYLSNAAGFVIVQETPVTGTVNIISAQPVTADDAVNLLNSVLYNKGYAVIRDGRILKIVSRSGIEKKDLPVKVGNIAENIPKRDEPVIQIIPIKYMDASKLMDNLRPLLAADATMTFNESSNAIILTDTQTNIHRMAEIIHALDTSISSISTVRVFALKYADAKDFANVLTQLFNTDSAGGGNNRNGQRGGQAGPGFFPGGGRAGGAAPAAGGGDGQSEARKAASRVIAVPDTQSNSVVVSAPEEFMGTISEIVDRLDTSTTEVTETRIFPLVFADCMELAGILNNLYADPSNTASTGQNGRNGGGRQQQQFNPYAPQQAAGGQPSDRALQQARVVTVPDPRTNSVIVSASKETMMQISVTIGRLDSSNSKKQKSTVIPIKNADPQTLATILQGMFTTQSGATTQTNSVLLNRQTTGASSTITNSLNTNGTTTGR